MLIREFDFNLPDELIAQEPLERRDSSRMLVVDRSADSLSDEAFSDFPERLRKGDLVVLNNTRVFPARLEGRTETGARVEIFLVDERDDRIWEALARPARRLKAGKRVDFGAGLTAEIVERADGGRVVARFECDGDFVGTLERAGRTPLPPYIKRPDERPSDRERYQTVYARERGSIAAPTAGLHFTPDVLERVRGAGAEIAEVTLHVGYGTFEPVRVDDLSEHAVLPERYEIGAETAEALNRAKADGRRIIAVGTTTTRTLETAAGRHSSFVAERAVADLTITPGYRFRAVGGLLTNFHLPKSSLLVLVSTFGGHARIMNAYRHAVRSRYRFYSYGDCMFVF